MRMRSGKSDFRNLRIELWIDGRGPALAGLKVKETDVETAVEAISTSPKLQKRGLVIIPEYLHIVNGRQKDMTVPAK